MLKTKEVAEILDVSEATIRRWRKVKDGPVYWRQGKIIRYSPDAIEKWRKKKEEKA